MRLFLIASLLIASSAMAHQRSTSDQNGLPVFSTDDDGDITQFVEEVPTPDSVYASESCFVKSTAEDDIGTAAVVVDQIVNMGEKVWSIVEKGKPVLETKYAYANALPQGVKSSAELDGFSPLQAKTFRVYGRNGFGVHVYDLTYTLVHRYGGRYQGKGQYLDNVTVLPLHASTFWGYTVQFGVTGISTTNIGTKEEPVAALTMELTMKVSTVLKSMEKRGLYDFHGDSADVLAIQ